MTDERLIRLRAVLRAHACESCASGVLCEWSIGVRRLMSKVKAELRAAPPPLLLVTREAPPDQAGLKPRQPGYLGHKTGPGVMKPWRPRTLRNRKKFFRNKENWARFKATAGIDGRITFRRAYERAGLHHITLSHYVNGLTDCKLSTALDLCEKLGCKIQNFARAMKEAWELAEQRYQAQEAINEAVVASEKGLDREASATDYPSNLGG